MSKNAITIVIAVLLAILVILGINAMHKTPEATDGAMAPAATEMAAPATDATAPTNNMTEEAPAPASEDDATPPQPASNP